MNIKIFAQKSSFIGIRNSLLNNEVKLVSKIISIAWERDIELIVFSTNVHLNSVPFLKIMSGMIFPLQMSKSYAFGKIIDLL